MSGEKLKIEIEVEDSNMHYEYFHNGAIYRDASLALRNQIQLNLDIKIKESLYMNIPYITLASFSCELFLKSLLLKKNTEIISTHTLENLFSILPKKDREKSNLKLRKYTYQYLIMRILPILFINI